MILKIDSFDTRQFHWYGKFISLDILILKAKFDLTMNQEM